MGKWAARILEFFEEAGNLPWTAIKEKTAPRSWWARHLK